MENLLRGDAEGNNALVQVGFHAHTYHEHRDCVPLLMGPDTDNPTLCRALSSSYLSSSPRTPLPRA